MQLQGFSRLLPFVRFLSEVQRECVSVTPSEGLGAVALLVDTSIASKRCVQIRDACKGGLYIHVAVLGDIFKAERTN